MNNAYDKDRTLLQGLGLLTTFGGREFTDIGTVTVHDANPDVGRPATTVKVEVGCLPAQFWRFTVVRPRDAEEYLPMETLVIGTGSGTFSDYWPAVLLVANHMFYVEEVQ